jgi:D-aminoacyl-tRNA deacylase
VAAPLVEAVVAAVEDAGVPTATGRFGAHMDVDFVNDGPVTILIEVVDGSVA